MGLSYVLYENFSENTIYDSHEWSFYCGATYRGSTPRKNPSLNMLVDKEAVEVENTEEVLINQVFRKLTEI
jgi:hypothetical protein